MEVQVAISPELGVELAVFVKQWNESASSRAVADARYVESSPKEMGIDPEMLVQGAIFLAGVAGGVALDMLNDVVKEQIRAYLKRKFGKKPPAVQVQSIRQPDGSYLIVVVEEEES